MITSSPPDRTESADYYFTYIDQVPAGDIRDLLEGQLSETLMMLRSIPEDRSLHRYAPDKWSISQVLSHINDTERVFSYRAFWFARALPDPLPSFDQDITVARAGADDRAWTSPVDEFAAVRGGTISLFRNLPDDAWTRRGIASGNPFTVRALAYITYGHVAHHLRLLRERYL